MKATRLLAITGISALTFGAVALTASAETSTATAPDTNGGGNGGNGAPNGGGNGGNDAAKNDGNNGGANGGDAKGQKSAIGPTVETEAEHTRVGVGDASLSDRGIDKPGEYRAQSIELNPLAFAIGRFGINYEYLPAVHHALVVNPHFDRASSDIAVTDSQSVSQSFSGFGAEAGYRYYTGHRGPNGFFAGPSLILGAYSASLPSDRVGFTQWGVALDAGAKTFIGRDFTLGAGVGLQWTHASHQFGDLPIAASAIASDGLKPRLLAEAGYAF